MTDAVGMTAGLGKRWVAFPSSESGSAAGVQFRPKAAAPAGREWGDSRPSKTTERERARKRRGRLDGEVPQ
jgi:hypothetical protein